MTDRIESRSGPEVPSEPNNGPRPAGVSRRTLLKHGAAIGAGAALSSRSVLAGMPPVDSNSKRGRIDVHHPMLTPFYMDPPRMVSRIVDMATWSPAQMFE